MEMFSCSGQRVCPDCLASSGDEQCSLLNETLTLRQVTSHRQTQLQWSRRLQPRGVIGQVSQVRLLLARTLDRFETGERGPTRVCLPTIVTGMLILLRGHG